MKRIILSLTLALLVLAPAASRADEGMWLLSLIGKNYADMQKAGFKLSPEDIYSINQNCIKDAIVGLGNEGRPFWHFCTGEIISNKGLISTNHHCGYGKLQEHSTVEHDYLRDGFWAYNMAQELPNPGLTASILVRMEDVTQRVLECLSDDMSEDDRAKAVRNVSERIAREAVQGTDYDATVKPMFNGNQYFLFVHIIYKDVRLVGAPPSSMGKFGGDTDNWSWPRHTCDFSMFRIYTAPDGKPAPYAKENIPLKPKHHLPVSARELKDGDFAMVLGFPGTTNHFLTSYGLKETMEVTNKLRYELRTVKINILREEMDKDQAIKIKYASKYAGCANYWKYSNEQNIALKKLNTMALKKEVEKEYYDWALDKDPKYRAALVAHLFSGSIFANQKNFEEFLKNPTIKKLERDEIYKYGTDILDKYREVYLSIPKENRDNLTRGTRDFVDGILQINAGRKLMSPDANSTIRLTYGNVKAYEPRDGVTYHFYTTLEGVMQKEDPTSTEFIVPQRLKDLYAAKDYGTYANAKGQLPTCFITNNDITGGNSGSPVLDAYGNLIGLAFDGNGEAMSGDIDFEENLQRCICLDSRYMLFVIDKYANAQNLIDEMDIVR